MTGNSRGKTSVFVQYVYLTSSPLCDLNFIELNQHCPYGIELNQYNFNNYYKYCNISPPSPTLETFDNFHSQVYQKVFILIAVGLVSFLLAYLQHLCFNISAKRQINNIRIKLFQTILNKHMSYFDTHKTGELSTYLFEYEQHLDTAKIANRRKGFVFGCFLGILYFSLYFARALGLYFGIKITNNVSDILVVITSIVDGVFYFGSIAPFTQSVIESMENQCETKFNDGLTNFGNSDIDFVNVQFSYPSRPTVNVLRNFNMTIRQGEKVALVGRSGCGKSTCIQLLLRFYEPTSGTIRIDGCPITKYNIKWLRQQIGVVSQEPILFATTIYENILYGSDNKSKISLSEIQEAAKEANAHNFIMKLPNKYNTLVGERGIHLSGGEKQRIVIARALINNPKILILDEATSALDNENTYLVQDALDRACKDRTIIIITHRLTTIRNADRIYVIDKGQIVEQGTHNELMSDNSGPYYNLVQTHIIDENNEPEQEQEDESKHDELVHKLYSHILKTCTNNKRQQQKNILFYCGMFAVLAVLLLVLKILQNICFAISGSNLTKRLRIKLFQCMLQQEVAWFDKEENYTGALCQRLSSDALTVQDLAIEAIQNVRTVVQLTKEDNFLSKYSLLIQQSYKLQDMGGSLTAIQSCMHLFDRQPSINNCSTHGKTTAYFNGDIQFDSVQFRYPERPQAIILDKFQLNIEHRQRIALVGPSGCGKSTIVQLIERFYDVNKGNLLSGGEKQRIAIARALLRRPKILLLDEATSAMDRQNETVCYFSCCITGT
ncbi:unnamed protein product [Didymodactylos carnosus]|uniref:Uncharacterized protein n=1 Tax=Didymodactylos carnosus TaxID=1234261 RepID=A0A814KTZ3_9BILA|nr:unnamed protein product [Didymodactylos carnosus]CAF3823394.1 unnamed protein product [Didymodactylos carnosus]